MSRIRTELRVADPAYERCLADVSLLLDVTHREQVVPAWVDSCRVHCPHTFHCRLMDDPLLAADTSCYSGFVRLSESFEKSLIKTLPCKELPNKDAALCSIWCFLGMKIERQEV